MPVFRKGTQAVLFAHIPKTGGSSVERAFQAAGWAMDVHDPQGGKGSLNWLRTCPPQHMHADLLRANFRLDKFSLMFTVVRHPFDRFRSEYVWKHRQDNPLPVDAAAVEKWGTSRMARYRDNPYLGGNHFRPQSEFILPGMQVLRFEIGLDTELSRLSATHGLGLPDALDHEKGSSRFGTSSADVTISQTLEDELRMFYRNDFQELGYR